LVPVNPVVVVLDGEQRAALAAVRSLGRRGCSVHVASSVARSLAGASRYAITESLLPDSMNAAGPFGAAVARLVQEHRAQVLLPVTEASTLALLERRELFTHVHIPTSDLEHFRCASDKAGVLSLARGLGIDVPSQWIVPKGNVAEPDIPLDAYPVVVKSARSIAESENGRWKTGVTYADSPQQLRRAIAEFGEGAHPLLVQTRVEGPGLGVFLLRWNGEILASFAHRRVREKPPSGGVSVCCESVAPPTELIAQSRALLAALDWTGVAMVEFKEDTRSGRTYLMEVNPRLWGSLQLAIDAGVDFPWYLVELAAGARIEPVNQWRVGSRSRWPWGDIDHLLTRLRHSRGDLHLPAGAPGMVQTALSVLNPFRPGQQSDVFRISDPAPFLRETIAWIRSLQS
jgi:predicted ATP-grasp superfamily ATP-dependent carboligase